MGLFGRFRKVFKRSSADRILSPSQIREVLASDYGSETEAVIFVYDSSSSVPITPIDMVFVPFIQADFSKDPKLGMVYGTGSGCALVRKSAIERVQALARTGPKNIVSCEAFIDALRELGYSVRQDPKLSLDLLP